MQLLPKLLALPLALLLAAGDSVAGASRTLYEHTVPGPDGGKVSLAAYQSKPVVLVVNVASQCGYTDSNYRQLQKLYEKYADSGLEIMAFPCNQFGQQEPGSNAEIQEFVKGTYGATFPVFGKLDVNGASAHELYRWLKAEAPPATGVPKDSVRWNFSKFLVVNGKPVRRYAHDVEPVSMEKDIVTWLRKAHTGEL